MKENHRSAMIVAYYLSKYDETAYEQLGFSKMGVAHSEIGRMLGVNPNTVKNYRDRFDPLHENPRVGWHKEPLGSDPANVVET